MLEKNLPQCRHNFAFLATSAPQFSQKNFAVLDFSVILCQLQKKISLIFLYDCAYAPYIFCCFKGTVFNL